MRGREAAMLVDRERRADKKSRSARSGVRNRKYQSVASPEDPLRGEHRSDVHLRGPTVCAPSHLAGTRRGVRSTPRGGASRRPPGPSSHAPSSNRRAASARSLSRWRAWWTREVNRYVECGLCRLCLIVSPVSVLLGILSDFRAVSLSVYLCVLASSECSRMGGPGPRSSDRII